METCFLSQNIYRLYPRLWEISPFILREKVSISRFFSFLEHGARLDFVFLIEPGVEFLCSTRPQDKNETRFRKNKHDFLVISLQIIKGKVLL